MEEFALERRAAKENLACALVLGLSFFWGCSRAPEPSADKAPPPVANVAGFGAGGIQLPYAASFVGSELCASCHPEEAETQKHHHMAQTSRRVTLANRHTWFAPGRLAKPSRWEAAGKAPRYQRTAQGVDLVTADDRHRAGVDVVFGSGHRGFTPVSFAAGRGMRELRVSFFKDLDRWVMTPGTLEDPDPLGYVRSAESSRDCLVCHTTALAWQDDRLDTESSVFGIACERCHGPGSAHSEGGEPELIFNPARRRSDEQVAFCGQCHRRPANAEPHHVLAKAPNLARHAGTGLMLSACYRRSPPESVPTCVECHDPHRNIDREKDDFNRPCLRCHKNPAGDHKQTELGDAPDCVRCHMPLEKEGFFGLQFTDHWIRTRDEKPPGKTSERTEYAEYLEAEYRRALDVAHLGRERKSKLTMRLGKLLVGEGKTEAGLQAIREALTFEPLYKDRILAAQYFARAGKTLEATSILERTIEAAPANNRAYHDLASIYVAAGNRSAAQRILRSWEKARPGDPVLEETRRRLRL